MRRPLLFLLVAAPALAALAPLAAQSVVTVSPSQCVWRAGDDPSWAAPNLDESAWQPYSTWKIETGPTHVWVRCHANVGSLANVANPAIQVTLYDAYELYLNGALAGKTGNMDHGDFDMNGIRSFPVDARALGSGPVTIALRQRHRSPLSNNGSINGLISSPLELRIGDRQFLDGLRASAVLARSVRYLGSASCYCVIAVLAVLLLVLYFYDRSRLEFLLLSIACLSLAALRVNEFATAADLAYPFAGCLLVVFVGNVLLTFAQYLAFFRLAMRRPPVIFWILVVLTSLTYLSNLIDMVFGANRPYWLTPLNAVVVRPASLLFHSALSFSPVVAFWPLARVPRRMRPLVALCLAWALADLVWFAVQATALPIPGVPNVFAYWGVPLLEIRAFTTAGVLAAILGLLFRDQRQVTEERALFAGEVNAARNVQQYLIPEHLPSTPGFAIASEYRPSREVGGDFFQVLPEADDGSLLIVIGDVAGKGIKAGMLATLIVGAVRTAASFTSDPVRILALLNERLYGRGLVTCLALRIEPDGSATLVNAGHLPPYLNGKELSVEGALPLGAVPAMQFSVSRFMLAAGDSLLLMTDGIVEAQNADGELFGFERIGELLRAGADGATLATAAQNYGQEDDITVLTLTLAPVAVAHA
jgi:stage II sporulation SpoE-like protein